MNELRGDSGWLGVQGNISTQEGRKSREDGKNYTVTSLYSSPDITGGLDGSVGTGTGYGLDDHGIRIRFPLGARGFSILYRAQTDSGAHPTCYLMDYGRKE